MSDLRGLPSPPHRRTQRHRETDTDECGWVRIAADSNEFEGCGDVTRPPMENARKLPRASHALLSARTAGGDWRLTSRRPPTSMLFEPRGATVAPVAATLRIPTHAQKCLNFFSFLFFFRNRILRIRLLLGIWWIMTYRILPAFNELDFRRIFRRDFPENQAARAEWNLPINLGIYGNQLIKYPRRICD